MFLRRLYLRTYLTLGGFALGLLAAKLAGVMNEAAAGDKTGADFDHEEGVYQSPDVILIGGKIQGDLPSRLTGPGNVLHLYASDVQVVESAGGYGGPDDGQNALCQSALQAATRAAKKVTCEEAGSREITEVWRGWSCRRDTRTGKDYATCAVEVKVECGATA